MCFFNLTIHSPSVRLCVQRQEAPEQKELRIFAQHTHSERGRDNHYGDGSSQGIDRKSEGGSARGSETTTVRERKEKPSSQRLEKRRRGG